MLRDPTIQWQTWEAESDCPTLRDLLDKVLELLVDNVIGSVPGQTDPKVTVRKAAC